MTDSDAIMKRLAKIGIKQSLTRYHLLLKVHIFLQLWFSQCSI